MYQHNSAGVFCLDNNWLGIGRNHIAGSGEHRALAQWQHCLELVNDLDESDDTASPIR